MAKGGQGLRGAFLGGNQKSILSLSPSPGPGLAHSGTPGVTRLACSDISPLGRAWQTPVLAARSVMRWILACRWILLLAWIHLPVTEGVREMLAEGEEGGLCFFHLFLGRTGLACRKIPFGSLRT